jgi:amidophosphoribosyltransferase
VADLVMPVPDTGGPAAVGFAEASGIPYREGMVRNRYVGRTFIQPSQALRQRGVNVKLSPLREQIRARRVVLVEDSIVRGTTLRKVIPMLRQAGAREVHMRIAAPPTTHSCFYGIDTPTQDELLASNHTVEEIRRWITADSLGYLSWDGLYSFLGEEREGFCDACFTGRYPAPIPKSQQPYQLRLFEAVRDGSGAVTAASDGANDRLGEANGLGREPHTAGGG